MAKAFNFFRVILFYLGFFLHSVSDLVNIFRVQSENLSRKVGRAERGFGCLFSVLLLA